MTDSHRLEKPLDGYHKSHDVSENSLLTHVGRRTPAGEYLRRFWQPVAMTSELSDVPLAVRLLGEDLVLFRTLRGELGLVERHCCHRGSSLEYGICTEEGISCCYHGWLYATDGRILETPNDPDSRVAGKYFLGAYPVHEFRGLIFTYMGPPDEKPEFPHFDSYDEPDNEMVPCSISYACNWLQCLENTMDPVHSVFLHTRMSGVQFAESWGVLPLVEYIETPLGVMNVNCRRWNDKVWIRTTETILPNINQPGAMWLSADEEVTFLRAAMTRWMVPVDDTNTIIIGWRHFNDRVDPTHEGDKTKVGKEKIDFVGQVKDERGYEESQRFPGDYEAIVSQRPIAIHDLETLCATDKGVALLRRTLSRQIKALQNGGTNGLINADLEGVINTFTHDTIFTIPEQEDDEAMIRERAHQVVESLFETAKVAPTERPDAFTRKIEEMR
jgi:nitrite reductase/ring-hydroxylating ferredoxin subunit